MINDPLVDNTPTIDVTYDKYGHCVLCHKYLIVEKIADGEVVKMFSGEHDEDEYMMNDGARIRITICKKCKCKNYEGKMDDITKSIIKGWQVEVNHLDWPEERKKSHMERYKSKKLIFKTSGISNDVVLKKYKNYIQNDQTKVNN